jgi:hypothetical protein
MRKFFLVMGGLTLVAAVFTLLVLTGSDGAGAQSSPLGPAVVVTLPSSTTNSAASASGTLPIEPSHVDTDGDGAPTSPLTVGPAPASAVPHSPGCEQSTSSNRRPEHPCPTG